MNETRGFLEIKGRCGKKGGAISPDDPIVGHFTSSPPGDVSSALMNGTVLFRFVNITILTFCSSTAIHCGALFTETYGSHFGL